MKMIFSGVQLKFEGDGMRFKAGSAPTTEAFELAKIWLDNKYPVKIETGDIAGTLVEIRDVKTTATWNDLEIFFKDRRDGKYKYTILTGCNRRNYYTVIDADEGRMIRSKKHDKLR